MKKPIAAILTDTHIKEDNLKINHSIFKESIDIAKSLGLKNIIHLGDIFNSRKSQTIELLKHGFYEVLETFRKEEVQFIAIPGNHDKVNYNSYDSFLDIYKDHPAFTLFTEPDFIDLSDEITLYLLPFYEDELYNRELNNLVQKVNLTTGTKLLGTHIGFNGAVMNNGTTYNGKIDKSLLSIFEKVYVGHFHDEQVIDDHIHYIGSSIQHNFGETPNKGLFILYDDLSYEKIPLSFPKYNTFKIDVEVIQTKDIEDLRKEREETGDNYRIILTGDKGKIDSYDKNLLRGEGIKVETEKKMIVAEDIQGELVVHTSQSILDYFEEFCDRRKLDYSVGSKYLEKVLR